MKVRTYGAEIRIHTSTGTMPVKKCSAITVDYVKALISWSGITVVITGMIF